MCSSAPKHFSDYRQEEKRVGRSRNSARLGPLPPRRGKPKPSLRTAHDKISQDGHAHSDGSVFEEPIVTVRRFGHQLDELKGESLGGQIVPKARLLGTCAPPRSSVTIHIVGCCWRKIIQLSDADFCVCVQKLEP